MATFIKNNCDCCQPAVCDECGSCANTITTTKQFLAPGSEPQDGMIIVSRFILNLSGLELCPCINSENPSLPCTPEMQEHWDYLVNNIYSSLSNPIVLEYYATNTPPSYQQDAGWPYFCFYAGYGYGENIVLPNQPFLPNIINGGQSYPCYSAEVFSSCFSSYEVKRVNSETETSITINNAMQIGNCPDGYYHPVGYGGTLTITWE